jgi:hypothetical protein
VNGISPACESGVGLGVARLVREGTVGLQAWDDTIFPLGLLSANPIVLGAKARNPKQEEGVVVGCCAVMRAHPPPRRCDPSFSPVHGLLTVSPGLRVHGDSPNLLVRCCYFLFPPSSISVILSHPLMGSAVHLPASPWHQAAQISRSTLTTTGRAPRGMLSRKSALPLQDPLCAVLAFWLCRTPQLDALDWHSRQLIRWQSCNAVQPLPCDPPSLTTVMRTADATMPTKMANTGVPTTRARVIISISREGAPSGKWQAR